MIKFKDQWTLEMAMKIVTNQTVDSETWGEAVEWIMLYGPHDIQNLLLMASAQATTNAFPRLKPCSYSPDGQPCYNTAELAEELQLTEEQVQAIIIEKEKIYRGQSIIWGAKPTLH
ncbi:hypothetical protein [Desulfotalea psychrophila]|uniref:hypothetical protein n=1 Tax=Desulfotalea psychrophila TaxID=84980 RepID=UPI00030661C2|nr:hypothetical protein [Desulfotalea psychrophila]